MSDVDTTPTPDATPTAAPPPSTEPAPSPPPPTSEPSGSSEPSNLAVAPAADPLPPPSTWPEDWRQQLAGDNEDDLKTLNRWKDPRNIFQAFKGIRSKVSAGDLLPVRPDTDDEAVLDEWRAQVGVPKEAAGYYDALSKDMEVRDEDRPFLDDYFSEMHKRGVPPADVAQGVEVYHERMAKDIAERLEADRTEMRATEDDLRAHLGPEYSTRMDHMRETLFGSNVFLQAPEGLKDLFFGSRTSAGGQIGNNPEVLSWMLDLAAIVNPDFGHTITPVAGQDNLQTLDQEIKAIELEMNDTKGRQADGYWNSPDKQARLRELYDAQERMKARRG